MDVEVRANDLDSHEFIPVHMWEEIFGPSGKMAETCWTALYAGSGGAINKSLNRLRRPDVVADDVPVDVETVWTMKGSAAPAAIDMHRRPEVLDAMGVDHQLIFPNYGFFGMGLASMNDDYFDQIYSPYLEEKVDHREVGLSIMRAHNDWLIRSQTIDPRLHLVAAIPTFDMDEMMTEARRVIAGGARCLWVPATVPPGGTSPGNEAMDPFWDLAEEHDIPIVLHIGTEPFISAAWNDAPAFRRDYDSEYFPTNNPYFMTAFYYAPENFLATMVLGGVFDRHPRLRFGAIECGAAWVGPLVERMELFAPLFAESRKLERPIAQYVADHVRVTPFAMEPVRRLFERNPNLADVFCFSSDYPHVEGGQHAKTEFLDQVAPLGDDIVEKFFRTNAQLLLV